MHIISLVATALFAALCFGTVREEGGYTPVCWLHFTADLIEGNESGRTEIHVTFSLEEEDICRDTVLLDRQLDWSHSGLRPLFQISTCPVRRSGQVNDTTIHTLISTLELMQTINSSIWIIELPSYLNTDCIDLTIRGSNVGTGAVLPQLRFRFGSVPRQDIISEVLSPQCVVNDTRELASWVVLVQNTTCEEGEEMVRFVPDQVHFITENELFITGNGLVYSPNQGSVFYQLLLPMSIIQIDQFVASEDFKTYAAIITSVEVGRELWLGFSGQPGVIRLYPSSLLDRLRTSARTNLAEMLEDNVTLAFTSQNELLLRRGDTDEHIPVPALVSSYIFSLNTSSSESCPSALLNRHALDLFTSGFSPLTLCPTIQCPFAAVTLEARVCREVTRPFLHLPEGGKLERQLETLPEYNCMITADELPRDIYLERLGTYSITVLFQLLDLGEVSNDVQYVIWSSDTTNLNITVNEDFVDDGNSLRYEIFLAELGLLTDQYPSGYDISQSVIELQIPGIGLQCVDPLSRFIMLPGSYRTRVHIGCPPGLSLVFDPNTTTSRGRYSQYCTPRDNISCYHFINAFLISDDVTGGQSAYSGQYTLRLVAGGEQADDMTTFDNDTNIEDDIWYPVNTLEGRVHHNGSGVRWVCGTGSPCGELLPGVGYLPRYYLFIEASTSGVMMENETYCDFSVQFLIELHGMPMGAVTSLVVLILWLFVLSILIVVLFVLWTLRERLKQLVEPVSGRLSDIWQQKRHKEWLVQEVKRRASSLKPLPFVQLPSEDDGTEQDSFISHSQKLN